MGYVGSEEGGELINKIQIFKSKVILIDEFEKATASVYNFFYELLEDGIFTDRHGTKHDLNGYILLRRLNVDVFTCLNFYLLRWSTLRYGPCLTDVHWTSGTINRCSTHYSSIFRLANRNLFCVKFIRYLTALVIKLDVYEKGRDSKFGNSVFFNIFFRALLFCHENSPESPSDTGLI